jgi:hypothetical protein
MASRDRITLTTPKARTMLKGLFVESVVHVDLSDRRITGFIRFYDTAGNIVQSQPFNARINQQKRDDLANAIIQDIIGSDPTLAGVITIENVNSIDDPVSSP